MPMRKQLEQFITEACNVHGNRYDYSRAEYTNANKLIDIVCALHGTFSTTPSRHLRGVGCAACYEIQRRELMQTQFLDRAYQVHGDRYDYTSVVYQGARELVAIRCFDHGVFYQSPNNHMKGVNCPVCAQLQRPVSKQLTFEEFCNRAAYIHGTTYTYPAQPFEGLTGHKIIITCSTHGNFIQSPRKHIAGHGCPLCRESWGERTIAALLDTWQVSYERQKRFAGLQRQAALAFDFYLPDYNLLIEYDGQQHFEPVAHFGGEKKHRAIKEADAIKQQWTQQNGIALLRIPYTTDDIAALLKHHLF